MTYDGYRYIFTIFAILCVIMLMVSVFLFYKFKIKKVIGDITGTTARKAINDIREQSSKVSEEAYTSNSSKLNRYRTTDKITNSGKIVNERSKKLHRNADNTEELSQDTVLLASAQETMVLSESAETMVLANNYTVPMFEVEEDTTYTHTDEVIN